MRNRKKALSPLCLFCFVFVLSTLQAAKLPEQVETLKKSLGVLKDKLGMLAKTLGNVKVSLGEQPKKPAHTSTKITGTKEDLDKYARAIKSVAEEINKLRKSPALPLVLTYDIWYILRPAATKLGKTSADVKADLEKFKFDDGTSFTEEEIKQVITYFEEEIKT